MIIAMFKSFLNQTPKEFTPLVLKQENGNIVYGYYVLWSNTMYLSYCSEISQVIEWKYKTN